MIRSTPRVARHVPGAPAPRRWSRLSASLIGLLLVAILCGPAPVPLAAVASGPLLPPYVYTVASGPYSFDVTRNAAGKESRVTRVAVAGAGLSDVSAQLAPNGLHAAVRVSGDRNGGSGLRLMDIGSSRAITVTLSRNSQIGVGAFAWAPNSAALAYTVASPQRADADSGAGTLWVVGADARGAHRLSGPRNARLIGWSPDSSGLYYGRDADSDGTTEDLWFQPLTGPAVPVLRSSPGGLQYSRFAVAAAPVTGGSPGAARVAALVSGDLSLLSAPNALPANMPHSRLAPHIAAADTPSVVVGDGRGGYRALPDSGEAYRVLAWDPTGTHLLFSGGKSKTAWYADAGTGRRWRLPAALDALAPVSWTPDGHYLLLGAAGGATNILITFNTTTGGIVRTRWPGAAAGPTAAATDLPVPYINQVWDTGTAFNGNWACGPTTVAMLLSYYGRLTPWPFPTGQARLTAAARLHNDAAGAEAGLPALPAGQLYGQYVSNAFTYGGHSFTATGKDPSGHRAQGLYGTIVGNTSLADWGKMNDVLALYGISTDYIPVTWASITATLDKGNPVVLGTTLTADGHILVARGYTANGYLLLNDPYGNRFGPEGYGGDDGENVAYAWKKIPAHLAMVVRGKITPPATPTPTASSTPTASPTPAASPTPTALPPSAGQIDQHGVNP